MQIKHLLAAAVMAMAALTGTDVVAQSNQMTDMQRAVMDSYNRMIEENPTDYQVYFRRGNEYYNRNEYSLALADINHALEYAPAKEKDLRQQCFALRASIYERMDMNKAALADLNSAIALDPSNYTLIYQRANIEYALGDYAAATADYKKLQSLNSRSLEALFGLARVAYKQGDTNSANRYADQAVELSPADAQVYLHRGRVRALMGNNQGAVDDYITAINFSKGSGLGKPIQALVSMSDTDYDATINGLTSAIARSPRQGVYYYIRGVIAQNHYRYPAAIADYDYVTRNYLLDYPGVYRCMAECYYALGKYELGLENADIAIGSSADNLDSYVVKSDIKRAMQAYGQAVTAADRALAKDSKYAPALLAKGIALLDNNLVGEASTAVGNAALAAPHNPYYLMARAWVLDVQGEKANSTKFYEDVLKQTDIPANDVTSFQGFALLYLGRTAEADEWMENVLSGTITDPETYYYAACYYSARGDVDRALEMTKNALAGGYANYHNWTENNDARINVQALRADARFQQLLSTYNSIFQLK